MTLTTAQTASGLKTFSTLPQSSVTPTNANDLVNKTYADSLVPTPVNAVTIDGTQTLLTGIKTFTNLPECSAVPTSGSQLVNKTYVDGLTPATPTLSQVLVAGNTATNSIALNNTGIGTNVISLLPNASASNPTITLTDGTTTNTIDKNGYTTRNSVQNSTHYLNFSDGSGTGTGAIQKTAGIKCNPSTNSITSTSLVADTAVTGANATLTQSNLTINTTGLSNASVLTLNQSGVGNGFLYTEKYNQKTASVGTSIQESFYAKNGAGTKTEQAKVRIDTPTGSVSQYIISVNQSGVLTNHLTCNGSSSSVDIGATNGLNMSTHAITGVTTITDSQALPFLPQGSITANSNVSTPITAYNNNHQLLLRASPIPFIDTFVIQSQNIGNCSILCSETSGGQQWLGTNCGEVYVYDAGNNNWKLITQLNGEIRSLYYDNGSDRLYIGGSFTQCIVPSSASQDLNYACYIPSASTTFYQVIPDFLLWSGATLAGFNDAVNAITSDNTTTIWFAGAFTADADGLILCVRFAVYNCSSFPGQLVPLNNFSGNGFDGAVNNLDWFGSTMCATGDFVNITTAGGPTPSTTTSPYCVTFNISSGYSVASVAVFDGGLGTLAYQIPGYDLITNNGSVFFVGAGQNSYAGADFFFQLTTNCIPSLYGTNIPSQLTNFGYWGGTIFTVTSGGYYQNGNLVSTIPFQSYIFNFNNAGVPYFNYQGVGTQWAFTGNTNNSFALQAGRTITANNGVIYTGGVICSPAYTGSNFLLNWDGSTYITISTNGPWGYF